VKVSNSKPVLTIASDVAVTVWGWSGCQHRSRC